MNPILKQCACVCWKDRDSTGYLLSMSLSPSPKSLLVTLDRLVARVRKMMYSGIECTPTHICLVYFSGIKKRERVCGVNVEVLLLQEIQKRRVEQWVQFFSFTTRVWGGGHFRLSYTRVVRGVVYQVRCIYTIYGKTLHGKEDEEEEEVIMCKREIGNIRRMLGC
jgi:hypothetical protein